MDKDILLYFRRQKKKGASRAAIAADKAGLAVIIFMASYFAFFLLLKNLFLALLSSGMITFAACCLISYIEKNSLEKFIEKEIKEIKRSLCAEKLLLCGKSRRMRFLEGFIKKEFEEKDLKTVKKGFVSKTAYYHIFENHPSCDVDANDMLDLYECLIKTKKKHCVAVCFSSFKSEAKDFMHMAKGFDFELCDKETLFSIKASLLGLITKEEVFSYIKRKSKQSRISLNDLKKEIFASKKFKAYIITGAALGALAFLSPFPAYFISMAALCMLLGVFTTLDTRQNRL